MVQRPRILEVSATTNLTINLLETDFMAICFPQPDKQWNLGWWLNTPRWCWRKYHNMIQGKIVTVSSFSLSPQSNSVGLSWEGKSVASKPCFMILLRLAMGWKVANTMIVWHNPKISTGQSSESSYLCWQQRALEGKADCMLLVYEQPCYKVVKFGLWLLRTCVGL